MKATSKSVVVLLFLLPFALFPGCSETAMNRPFWELALPGYKPPAAGEPCSTLAVSRSTPNIFVYIDGAPVKNDASNFQLDISPGTHKVRIEYHEGSTFSTPIRRKLEFKEGRTVSIDVRLESQGVAVRMTGITE